MEFKNTETLKNITRAFAGECMDGAKYQYLADTATQQKLSQVASVLKALAHNGHFFHAFFNSSSCPQFIHFHIVSSSD